jgi:uncharacterized protein
MDGSERQVIDGLFDKLRQVDQQAPRRDADAEAHIRQQVAALPSAPYYMAQALLVQEQALGSLQARVQQLEREATDRQAGGGGFLSGLFGGQASGPQAARPPAPAGASPIPPRYLEQGNVAGAAGPWGRGGMGGGFLAGAMQTAMGVAGGVLLADALSSAFSSGTAEAEELAHQTGWTEPAHTDAEPPEPMDASYDEQDLDAGGDDGFDV